MQSGRLNTVDCTALGKPGARTEIVVFSDFQCSFCKKAAREIYRLNKSSSNKFVLYFKHYPLKYHPLAFDAAKAAEAARLQGKFWEMHDGLFAYGKDMTKESFATLARKLMLDMEKFNKDFNSPEVTDKVNADKKEGEKLGVRGTPYFIINRRPFHGSYVDLKRQI